MTTKTIYNVVTYKDAKDFLNNTQSELENDEIFNTFVLWISDVKANTPGSSTTSQAPQSYSALFQDDQLMYVLVCADGNSYVGWNGQQQQHVDTDNTDLVNAIKDLLLAGVPLAKTSTLYGYSPVVNVFDNIRQALTSSATGNLDFIDTTANDDSGKSRHANISTQSISPSSPPHNVWSYQIAKTQDILWTDRTRQLARRATLRLAVWMDYPLLVKWSEAFVRDCGLNDGDLWNRCALEIQKGYSYFWCLDNGEPVAMIWKRRALRHGISLAYVYTPNETRRRGYAAAMVAQMTEYLLKNEGYRYVTLLVNGDRDPTKNMYTSVGYQLVGSMTTFNYQNDS